MCLLVQLNGDLPEHFEGHERRLYVFACRSKSCRKKAGTVRALRGIRILPTSAEKEREGKMTFEIRNSQNPASVKVTSDLGNSLFGARSSSEGAAHDPFTSTATTLNNPFAAPSPPTHNSEKTVNSSSQQPFANPFAASSDSHHSHLTSGPPKPAQPAEADVRARRGPGPSSELLLAFAEKARIASPSAEPARTTAWPPEAALPKPYPSYHLGADYELLEPTPPPSSKAKMENVEINGPTTGHHEDTETFESAMDKTFQRFADRLGQNPEQVLRYEFGGAPLLYSKNDAVGKLLATTAASSHGGAKSKVTTGAATGTVGMPNCPNCSQARVFEVQIVPQAISELEVEETGLDGMEWGTIIVGVCSADCRERGIGNGEWGWLEEWVGVQWEEEEGEDGKAGR